MRFAVGVVAALIVSLMGGYDSVGAQQSLRVQPLEYRSSLEVGETKKAFIDLTNPGSTALTVTMTVQGFRQIDDTGTLEFYDNEAIRTGITPDYNEFELGPRETIRLYFLVKGSQLPTGDVFAALFASGRPVDATKGMVSPVVRVGTLLSLQNGTPGARQARITHLQLPFFQFGEKLEGEYVIRNTADATQTTGFYPTVTISVDPLRSQQEVVSKLVYAGRSRTNEFSLDQSRLGFYKVAVSYSESTQSTWVFMATGPWLKRLVAGLIIAFFIIFSVSIWRKRQARAQHTDKQKYRRH